MSSVASATIEANWGERKETWEVQHNPKEFTLEKAVQYGEIAIPGLDAPLQQYIRGQAEKLTVELFFDTTEKGLGKGAESVTEHTDRIYKLTKIENSSHAPPIVTFCWNSNFPGSNLSTGDSSGSSGNQTRNVFVGVAESVRQQFSLFSSEGVPLRATVNLVLREYRPIEQQLQEMRLNSPDKTHSHPLSDKETLSGVAATYYSNCHHWRYIAEQNKISDPRRLQAGDVIEIPAISEGQ